MAARKKEGVTLLVGLPEAGKPLAGLPLSLMRVANLISSKSFVCVRLR